MTNIYKVKLIGIESHHIEQNMNICRSVSRCCRDGHSSHKKDSKWAWTVCLAASTNMAFTAGLLFCFGVLLPVFMDYFNESRERTGMKSIQPPFPFDIEIKKVIKLQVFKRYPSLASLYIHNQTAFIIIRQFFIIFFSTLTLHEYIIVSKLSSSISPPLNPSPPPPHHTHWRKTTQGAQGCTKLCAKLCEETPTPLNHSLNKFWLLHTNSKDISMYVIGRKSNNFSILDTNLKSLMCTVEDI